MANTVREIIYTRAHSPRRQGNVKSLTSSSVCVAMQSKECGSHETSYDDPGLVEDLARDESVC